MKHKIAKLLANGATPAQAARAAGCTESYVSQLISMDAEFDSLLTQCSAAILEDSQALDEAYANVEAAILIQLNDKLPTANVTELAKALTAVTANTKRGANLRRSSITPIASATVNLTLPQHVIHNLSVVKNARSEIIEIDGENFMGLTETQFNSNLSLLKLNAQEETNHAQTNCNEGSIVGARFEEIDKIVGDL